ncbi:MAG TPA: hypothetical protein PLP14_11485, partial [Chitinophagaceae bacterium]|nr:hypothetical protein [Chitinophagaceae bacterium]
MTKLFSFLALFCVTLIVVNTKAQSPQGISYQAIARDISGNVLSNQNVGVRFIIRNLTSSGTIVYRETHNTTTNSLGLFTLTIGMGTPTLGTFTGIPWSTGAKFLQVDLDPAGGNSYVTMGTTQMMSVPYALYAETANVPGVAGPGYTATSTTSNSISIAIKNFTTQSGLAYLPNMRVRVANSATAYMEGVVSSYIGTSLVINVDRIVGSGTFSSWNIGITGDVGAVGATGSTGATGSAGIPGADGDGYAATSSTSLPIGLGNKSLVTQSGLAYLPNMRVRLANSASNYMEGVVTSYTGVSLAVNVDRIVGSGTFTSWNIGIAGDVGPAGATGATGPTGATGATGP